VQVPARITLPVSAQNVLILNNSVTQPIEHGIERNFDGNPIRSDFPLSLDSTVWFAMDEIAVVLNESNFFNTITTYKVPIRDDDEWLSLFYLSPEQQDDYYNRDNFDALLVIERLFLFLKEDIKSIKINAFPLPNEKPTICNVRADGVITCSMYTYGQDKPLITFNASDSLSFQYTDVTDSIFLFKEIPEIILNTLSIDLGNKVAKFFTPTWKTQERNLFVNRNSRMQEALGYASSKKWTNAELIWKTELEKKTKLIDKAKIAYNMAVANEMQDNFDLALEWAQKAKEFMNHEIPDDSKEIKLVDDYILMLNNRIENNLLLDLQWGKE